MGGCARKKREKSRCSLCLKPIREEEEEEALFLLLWGSLLLSSYFVLLLSLSFLPLFQCFLSFRSLSPSLSPSSFSPFLPASFLAVGARRKALLLTGSPPHSPEREGRGSSLLVSLGWEDEREDARSSSSGSGGGRINTLGTLCFFCRGEDELGTKKFNKKGWTLEN